VENLKKSLLIIILLVLIAIGGGGYWFFVIRKGGESTTPSTSGESSEEGNFAGSIADALEIGTAMKCTWSYQEDTATFYLKSNKYRGDMTPKGEGKMSYIYRDNCTYFWQEGEKQGVKWCVTPAEGEEYTAPDMGSAGFSSAALGYEYSCLPTVVSDSVFTLPSGIKFTDFSQYTQ
jgi:uncharacterized protein YxeA